MKIKIKRKGVNSNNIKLGEIIKDVYTKALLIVSYDVMEESYFLYNLSKTETTIDYYGTLEELTSDVKAHPNWERVGEVKKMKVMLK